MVAGADLRQCDDLLPAAANVTVDGARVGDGEEPVACWGIADGRGDGAKGAAL